MTRACYSPRAAAALVALSSFAVAEDAIPLLGFGGQSLSSFACDAQSSTNFVELSQDVDRRLGSNRQATQAEYEEACRDACIAAESGLPDVGELGCCRAAELGSASTRSCQLYKDTPIVTWQPGGGNEFSTVFAVLSPDDPGCPTLRQTFTAATTVTCPTYGPTPPAPRRTSVQGPYQLQCPANPSALAGDAEITLKSAATAWVLRVGYAGLPGSTATSVQWPYQLSTQNTAAMGMAMGDMNMGDMGVNMGDMGMDMGSSGNPLLDPATMARVNRFSTAPVVETRCPRDGSVSVQIDFRPGAPIDIDELVAVAGDMTGSSAAAFTIPWCGCTLSVTPSSVESTVVNTGIGSTCRGREFRGNSVSRRVRRGAALGQAGSTATRSSSLVVAATAACVAVAVVVVAAVVSVRRVRSRADERAL